MTVEVTVTRRFNCDICGLMMAETNAERIHIGTTTLYIGRNGINFAHHDFCSLPCVTEAFRRAGCK